MANDVINRLIFSNKMTADMIYCELSGNRGKIDFNLLITCPPWVYRGQIGDREESDFWGGWHEWNKANWGTPKNAIDSETGSVFDVKERGYIQFTSAWSVPYPIIVTIANLYNEPFQHWYCEEFQAFWGRERWEVERGIASRVEVRASMEEDRLDIVSSLMPPPAPPTRPTPWRKAKDG